MENVLAPETLAAEVKRLAEADQLEPMVALVERAAGTLDDPELANRLRLRAALACLDALAAPARAARLLEAALLDDPTSDEVLDGLRDAYAAIGDWALLRDVRQRQIELENDPQERLALLYEKANLEGALLGDFAAAIETYQQVLELDPNQQRALSSLEALYLGQGKWEPLVLILQREADLASSTADAVGIYRRMGELFWSQLDQPLPAAQCFRKALELCELDPKLASEQESLRASLQATEAEAGV